MKIELPVAPPLEYPSVSEILQTLSEPLTEENKERVAMVTSFAMNQHLHTRGLGKTNILIAMIAERIKAGFPADQVIAIDSVPRFEDLTFPSDYYKVKHYPMYAVDYGPVEILDDSDKADWKVDVRDRYANKKDKGPGSKLINALVKRLD